MITNTITVTVEGLELEFDVVSTWDYDDWHHEFPKEVRLLLDLEPSLEDEVWDWASVCADREAEIQRGIWAEDQVGWWKEDQVGWWREGKW